MFTQEAEIFLSKIKETSEKKWMLEGKRKCLRLFHEAAENVPAYEDFLQHHHINHKQIKNFSEYLSIPLTDKSNYIDKYHPSKLLWKKKNSGPSIISASSGTTGMKHFWYTSGQELKAGAVLHEIILEHILQIGKEKTLIIINFGMGTWIAGLFTLISTFIYSQKKQKNISIITPGFNKEETLNILNSLATTYEQIIFAGYPTFIKDILEQWLESGSYNGVIKFIFAGEGITEEWRDYILAKSNALNPYTSSVNIFGSADASFMGFESPVTILLRRQCNNKKLLNRIFKSEIVPSTAVYIPTQIFFESIAGELVLTSDRSIPLIRYNSHDKGGVLRRVDINSKFDFKQLIIDKKLKEYDYNLPLVYVFGRDVFGATIYAANIYSENVKAVLINSDISSVVTGRFALSTKYNKDQNHYLSLIIELKKDIKPSKKIEEKVAKIFFDEVPKNNSEYKKITEEYGLEVQPKVKSVLYGISMFGDTKKFKTS